MFYLLFGAVLIIDTFFGYFPNSSTLFYNGKPTFDLFDLTNPHVDKTRSKEKNIGIEIVKIYQSKRRKKTTKNAIFYKI
jgi:hypothetical protein